MLPKLDRGDTGLIIVDMQNGFCHPEGNLALSGMDVSHMLAIVPAVKRLVEGCQGAGIKDFWSLQHHYLEDQAHLGRKFSRHGGKRGRPSALKDSWHSEVVEDLKPLAGKAAEIFVKHRYSCFHETNLNQLLKIHGIKVLIICGVATNICVETTIRQAHMLDYDVVVVEDCVAGGIPELHRNTLENTRRFFGLVVSLSELEQMIAP